MLCFEDVALALRQAGASGEPAAFVVERDFLLDGKPLLTEGQRLTSDIVPSLLGWVAAGVRLRHA